MSGRLEVDFLIASLRFKKLDELKALCLNKIALFEAIQLETLAAMAKLCPAEVDQKLAAQGISKQCNELRDLIHGCDDIALVIEATKRILEGTVNL
jgi:hypothetical protein